MAEQSGEKSQEATPHRKEQAREQGQVAYSQDLGSAALLIVGVLLLRSYGREVISAAGSFMRHQLSTVASLTADSSDLVAQSQNLIDTLGKAMLPIVGLLALAGVLSSVFQIGFLFVPERLLPDFKRLSPLSGLGRIFSLSGAMKLGFGMFKVTIVATVASVVLYLHYEEVMYASALVRQRTSSVYD